MDRPPTPMTSLETLAPAPRDVNGVVFGTDAVVTDSSRPHTAAWKTAFGAFPDTRPRGGPDRGRPYDARYGCPRYVDGTSRSDGAADFLTSRGLDTSDDMVRAVAAGKERLFAQRPRTHGVDACPGTVRPVPAPRRAGVRVAAASASRHAGVLLHRAEGLNPFGLLVDGGETARLRLPGRPRPGLFLEAVRRLGIHPGHAAAVKDAQADVEAGRPGGYALVVGVRRGGFALVVGVDRAATGDSGHRPPRNGADVAVRDLAELSA